LARVTSGESASEPNDAENSVSAAFQGATLNFFSYYCLKLNHASVESSGTKFSTLELAAAVNPNYPFADGESQGNFVCWQRLFNWAFSYRQSHEGVPQRVIDRVSFPRYFHKHELEFLSPGVSCCRRKSEVCSPLRPPVESLISWFLSVPDGAVPAC
jgi:hypothetical protein